MKRTYDVAEVAELLGIARNSAYLMIQRDDAIAGVPALHVGRRILFSRAAIDEVLGITTTKEGSSVDSRISN